TFYLGPNFPRYLSTAPVEQGRLSPASVIGLQSRNRSLLCHRGSSISGQSSLFSGRRSGAPSRRKSSSPLFKTYLTFLLTEKVTSSLIVTYPESKTEWMSFLRSRPFGIT